MKRVAHPTCVACGKIHPEFESERFKIRVCYTCLLSFATRLHREGLLMDQHPLITELFDGVFHGGVESTETHMPVIVRSQIGTSTYSFLSVEKFLDS